MTALSPLERLGLEVAAERLLCGNRGLGRLLSVLLLANGNEVSKPVLMGAVVSKRESQPPSCNSLYVRIRLLRSYLEDVGFARAIESRWGGGYYIPEPARSVILDRLTQEAAS